MTRIRVAALLACSVLSACSAAAPTATPSDRLPVQVETAETRLLESFPVQLMLHITGWLPNPCAQPEWVVAHSSGPGGSIEVELYAVQEPGEICIQVLAPFEVNIPLGPQPEGRLAIFLNGEALPTQ